MRAMYRFGKRDRLKFVSHLDLQRFFQRAVRRTDLPIAYSQGFNPHPLISFASALAMGWTSEAEIVDIRFSENVTKDIAMNEMLMALPPDLPLYQVRLVDDRYPAAMAMVKMADYAITADRDMTEAAKKFLSLAECIALRKTKKGEKPTDVRPMCRALSVEKTDFGSIVKTRLMLTETETFKPDLLMRTLASVADMEEPAFSIHRTCLLGQTADGQAVPVMEL
ncbi:MAG: TIGR03936 family radical SAM-associated protein [Christensenellales bacterium]|jgi:radical SAM-linked protein